LNVASNALLKDGGPDGVLRKDSDERIDVGGGRPADSPASRIGPNAFSLDARLNIDDAGDVVGVVNAVRLDFELELDRECDLKDSRSDPCPDDDEEDESVETSDVDDATTLGFIANVSLGRMGVAGDWAWAASSALSARLNAA